MLGRPRHWIIAITGWWCLACTIPVVGEGNGGRRWEGQETGWREGWDTWNRWPDEDVPEPPPDADGDTDDDPPADFEPFAITETTVTCTDGSWALSMRTNAWADGGEVRVWKTADPEPTPDTDAPGDSGTTDEPVDSGSPEEPVEPVLVDTWALLDNVAYDSWGTWDEWAADVGVVSGEPQTGTTTLTCDVIDAHTFVFSANAAADGEVACSATGHAPDPALEADDRCE